MSVTSIHIIPDSDRLAETLKLCEKWKVNLEYNDFFIPALLDDRAALRARIDKYKSLERPAGIDTLHGVFFDMCLNSLDSKIADITRERMRGSMEIAAELGCKGVVFHTNLIPGFETESYLNAWLNSNAEFYRMLLKEYSGMEIYLENMFDYKPDMLIEMTELMKDESRFGICFDVAHSNIHMLPMQMWMSSLAPAIRHLHINDNEGKTDDHLAIGEGSIDWKNYFELIDGLNIEAGMLIEVSSASAQEKSLKYLKENHYLDL